MIGGRRAQNPAAYTGGRRWSSMRAQGAAAQARERASQGGESAVLRFDGRLRSIRCPAMRHVPPSVYQVSAKCPLTVDRPEHALGSTMTANKHPSSAGRAKFSRRRLVPLIVVAVVSGVVIAMGWQRQLSFETLARHYAALREFIAAHEVSAVAAYVAIYIVTVALSVPVGVYLTVAGGILFGGVLGGTAAVVGATIGAICIFL